MRTKNELLLITILCFWGGILFMPCAEGNDTIFRGRVIDADTKEPIEGTVVVAYWLKAWQTISGEKTELKEVKEILTDKNGEWSIAGPKGQENDPHPYFSFFLFLSYIREPAFIVFKPGYCSFPSGFSISACKEKLKPGGTGEIMEGKTIELSKLPEQMNREDILMAVPGPIMGESALEKQRQFIKLMNEGKKSLGLPEIKY